MERRDFIRFTGLTTLGLITGSNLLASAFTAAKHEFIEIKPPKIHVRHGLFNVHSNKNNGLHIQRDIFNGNGLEQISEERMASIKISDITGETFGISDKNEFKSNSSLLTAIKLVANKATSIKIDSPSIVFSEFEELSVNGALVKNDRAILQTSKAELRVLSNKNQYLFIYSSNKKNI